MQLLQGFVFSLIGAFAIAAASTAIYIPPRAEGGSFKGTTCLLS